MTEKTYWPMPLAPHFITTVKSINDLISDHEVCHLEVLWPLFHNSLLQQSFLSSPEENRKIKHNGIEVNIIIVRPPGSEKKSCQEACSRKINIHTSISHKKLPLLHMLILHMDITYRHGGWRVFGNFDSFCILTVEVHPIASSIKTLKGIPPALFVTTEDYILYTAENEEYARKLNTEGVNTISVKFKGVDQGFTTQPACTGPAGNGLVLHLLL